MKMKQVGLMMVIFLMASSCYAELTGTVIDAETGEPIEGAIVLVEWTITKGLPGLKYTESYEVKEALTDKEGSLNIEDVPIRYAKPHVTIYKKGYVAWNSEFIFPDYKKRTDFRWGTGYVFKLEKFKSEYTYSAHTGFMRDSIHSGMALEKKTLMKRAFDWETKKASEERRKKELR